MLRLTPRGGADRVEGVGPAAELRIPLGSVMIERGQSSRVKRIHLEGVDGEGLRRRWPGLSVT
jgi:hypothetical protein